MRLCTEAELTNKWGKAREALYRNDVCCLCSMDNDECSDTAALGRGTVCR